MGSTGDFDKLFSIHIKEFNAMQAYTQHYRTKINRQFQLQFGRDKNNMSELMALSDRIRTVLLEMEGPDYGKQAKLAEIAGAGRPVVNHWLSGQQGKINPKHALAISAKLGYRVEWLMEGRGPKKKDDPDIEVPSSSGEKLFMVHVTQKEMEILSAYRSADQMDRTVIEHLCLRSARDQSERKKDN